MKKYIATWSVHKERAHSHTHMNFRYVFLDFCLSFCMSFYVFYDRISKNTWDSCAQPNAQPSLSRVLWLVCTIPTCLYNYIYIYIYLHTHTYIYIYTYTHIYIYTSYTYIHIYIYMALGFPHGAPQRPPARRCHSCRTFSLNQLESKGAESRPTVVCYQRFIQNGQIHNIYIYNITWRYSV